MQLAILEHASPSYAPRTAVNAKTADATLAFAVDFNSAGERLTRRVAEGRYLAVPLSREPEAVLTQARNVFRFLRAGGYRALNIAGNSIATLSKQGWGQADVDQFVWGVLSKVNAHWTLESIRSGGQTGADVAGAVTGIAMSIPTTVLLPKGLLQRGADGVDVSMTKALILQQIVDGTERVLSNQPR